MNGGSSSDKLPTSRLSMLRRSLSSSGVEALLLLYSRARLLAASRAAAKSGTIA